MVIEWKGLRVNITHSLPGRSHELQLTSEHERREKRTARKKGWRW